MVLAMHSATNEDARKEGSARRFKQNIMEINEELEDPILKWRLCDELTVVQAALLTLDVDPAKFSSGTNTMGAIQMEPSQTIAGYPATVTALANAILAGSLPAKVRSYARPWGYGEIPQNHEATGTDISGVRIIYNSQPDWRLTTVSVDDLRDWLEKRGVTDGFFFPSRASAAPDYLDPNSEHYSPKLAAAVSAWQAVANDPNSVKRTTVKKAITTWLKSNVNRFGIRGSKQVIEQIARVANWNQKGGAPKTSTGN